MGKTSPTVEQTLRSMKAAFHMTKQRCLNPRCPDYRYYGGRGIRIEPSWLESFDNFVADMGLRPPGMTLERKDNDKDYTRDNCVWATRATQSSNTRAVRRITWQGITDTCAGWEKRLGIKTGTLKARFRLGYTVEQALTKPVGYGISIEGRLRKSRSRESYLAKDPKVGLDHANTQLTKRNVLAMRRLAAQGISFSELGRRYGVSVTTASNAVQAKGAYKHV